MTKEDAIKMAKAKLECIERQISGKAELCNNDCESCSLCYEQGNMGEQKEWLKMAIKSLEQKLSVIHVSNKNREEITDWSGAQGNTINREKEENERGHWGIYG